MALSCRKSPSFYFCSYVNEFFTKESMGRLSDCLCKGSMCLHMTITLITTARRRHHRHALNVSKNLRLENTDKIPTTHVHNRHDIKKER